LLNAFQSIYIEWGFMPLGIVVYGGESGGLRAAQTIRTMASTLLMFVTETTVTVPHVTGQVSDGVFTPRDSQRAAASAQLGELAEVAAAFAGLRATRRGAMAHH
jgi:NAD(P)H-dependent FMN reductase